MAHNRTDDGLRNTSQTPLGMLEAAEYARLPIKAVRKAMKDGCLMWKRLGNDKFTARPWIEEWMNG